MLMTSWLRSVQNRLILNRRRAMRRRPERENTSRATERLEDKTLLVAPTLVAVQPNVGEFLVEDEIRNVAPQQITLQFNPGQQIDAATLGAITVTRTVDGSFGNGDDAEVPIGFVGLGDVPEEVVLRFSENLPDDSYRINIDGASDTPLRNIDGEAFNDGRNDSFPFELDLGAQVVSIVPQPITRRNDGSLRQDRNEIVVYFNDDDLDPAVATDPSFYDLIFTNDTTTNLDDSVFNPTSVAYDPAADTATLTFISNIHNLGGEGTYRLRIGTDEAIPQAPVETTVTADPGDAFRTADSSLGDLASLGNSSHVLSAAIEPQVFELDFPGSHNEPGHRDIEAENHIFPASEPLSPAIGFDGIAEALANGETGADATDGISTIFYNFQDQYGFDPNGIPLLNVITEAQKQRAREVFELFSTTAGLDFVETDNQGLTIVTGDPRAIGSDPSQQQSWNRPLGIVIMNANVTWNDEIALPGVGGQESWFHTALSGIGRLLGLGYTGDLPEDSSFGDEPLAGNGSAPEPDFAVDADAVHLQHRFRPDSIDIDLYEFEVSDAGLFNAEVVAERRSNASNLDSVLRLFDIDGNVIAQNDDYFSEDSVIEIDLEPGTYIIGVSASGNDDYDPVIAGTGIDGTSQGEYDLRLNFRPSVDDTLVDTTGTAFDGDRDGVAGGVENFWFYAARPSDVLIVDKIAPNGGTGTIGSPYNQIDEAFRDAQPGDVVRIVGNGGADGDISTIEDNEAYEIGFDVQATPQPLADGATMDVPMGVTTMIDAGALLKFHRARIGVGSSTSSLDNSGAALQVLGIPGTDVLLTSWLDESVGNDTTPPPTTPAPGNWGGIMFQNDIDNEQANFNYENEGIFLNYVSHADIQYGGGNVVINSTAQTVNPIHLTEARPTIINNRISLSADSAMSADPDSFEETNFNTPQFQTGPAFTQDYNRVGPDIYGNILVQNSTNGLFIRVETAPGSAPNRLNVAARLDDTDIVHVLTGNLEIAGTPGGAVLDSTAPSVILVTLEEESLTAGTLTAGTYNYRVTFVDSAGNESPASNTTREITVTGPTSTVRLENLPPADAGFVGRRIYRSDPTGGGDFSLIANLDSTSTTFLDDGTTLVGTLDPVAQVQLARMNARLALDAGTILKLDQARLELGFGASLIAEGDLGREIILTSRRDDSYGIGGTFDTNNDDNDAVEAEPAPGDWGGIYGGHTSHTSIDRSLITFGGGITPLEGNFATFNVLEIHQATARVTNSVFENNADGTGGPAPENRFGRLPNSAGTIFVRASQPIIVDNIVRDSEGPAITINANALNHEFVRDAGRSRGLAETIETFADNQGPLVRGNVFGRNQINGMEIRGETLTTGSVWDDTDIVHVLQSEIYIPDLHTFGGLRLESSSDASLVVKLEGDDAGFTANGRPLDIVDRIGGALHIVGQPFRPVVLTSLADDSIGSGFGLDGLPLTDTNSDGNATSPGPGDWRSVLIDQFAHDRNVDIIVENETANELSPDTNGAITIAEFLGELGEQEKDSDENLRLGFTVNGSVSRANDVDVYSFVGSSGTEIWIDLDQTRHAFDGVVELLNANGQIIAQSDNSLDEFRGNFGVYAGAGNPNANVLAKSVHEGIDYYSTNQRDAGFRVVLPGSVGSLGTFFIRVRASNIDSLDPASDRTDLQDDSKLSDGLTFGGYELEVRLREIDETPGSTVRYSDIRFATNGIEVFGHPSHSPLTGEIAESAGPDGNDTLGAAVVGGNLGNSNRAALSFAGTLSAADDIDFFEFDVIHDSTEADDPFPDLHVPVTIDLDYADGFSRANTTVSIFDEDGRLVYVGRDSNISEDRPAPLNGADVDDLSRGSIGPNDAFIGPVELVVGRYFMAVTSNGQIPNALQNTATRLEPLTTFNRISEEQFGNDVQGTAGETISDLFTTVTRPDGSIGLDPSHTDFHLSDVSLFVSAPGITGGASGIYTVDGFTGAVQNHVGSSGIRVDDIATRPDGELFSFANSVFTAPPNDANLGHYTNISTDNATFTDVGNDGLTTWFAPDCTTGGAQQANIGVFYNALHFDGTAPNAGLAVGNNFASSGNFPDSFFQRNALYNFNIETGAAINQEVLPRLGLAQGCDGAHTNLFEVGRIDAAGENFITGLADARDTNGDPNSFGATDVYAIDNAGVLYAVDYQLGTRATADPRNRNVQTTTIRQVIDRPFSGLVAGPRVGTEDGLYEQLLFGITTDGEIYVFDTSGNLQPILAGGTSVVQTGITNADGIAFGTLDYNLWDVTDNRANDAGHGFAAAPDGSREATPGGTSLYFGNQNDGRDAGNKNNSGFDDWIIQANEQNNIDFPGGAQGDVVSNEFSLKGYSAGDKPTLYFNYFIETEDSNGADVADSIRVYVGGDETFVDTATGEMTPWSLVATNNSTRIDGPANDELDYGIGPFNTDFPDSQSFPNVSQLQDVGDWRQVRVDLSEFAGSDNLRLRFVFSSAGGLNIGQQGTSNPLVFPASGGEELYSLPGADLRDGDQFTVAGPGGPETFTFDLGFTLVAPSGAGIAEGDTFTIDGTTFEFDSDGSTTGGFPVAYSPIMTANELGQSIEEAIEQFLAGTILVTRNGNRVNVSNAATVTENGGLTLEGAPGGGGANRIPINSGMTRDEVAAEMRIVLANALANGQLEAIQGTRDRIVFALEQITDPGPLPAGNILPGEEFGQADSNIGGPSPRGTDNKVEGVYIDDIIIGFAERGELATAAPIDSTFVTNPDSSTDILTGQYDVEVRRAAEVGFAANGALVLNRVLDTNHRFTDGTSISFPNPGGVADGDTFSISDGNNIVVFEFEDVNSSTGVRPGHQPILFDPINSDPSHEAIASAVRDAINSPAVQGILDIVAGLEDGTIAGSDSSSCTVNLYGNAIVDTERPVDDFGVLGEINPVESLNSDDLFTFENHSSTGEQIESISLVLPEGLYFDPNPGSGAPNGSGPDGPSGPDVSANSGAVGQSFTFDFNDAGLRDEVRVLFSDFDAGETFEFGVDIETSNDPEDYIGTRYTITFDSGRIVDGFFQDTQDVNPLAHDSVIDPTRRDFVAVLGNRVFLTQYDDFGDSNNFRDQGQVLIQQNTVTDSAEFGIVVDAGVRNPDNIPLGGSGPHQGPVRNLQEINTENLVPGVIVENNVVARGGTGGILVSGETGDTAPVPHGRLVNNTVVGTGAGIGIQVNENAGPTILNNILADFTTGIQITPDSQATTVLGTTLYQGNGTDADTGGIGLGTFALVLADTDPLFIDEANGNYYPAPTSRTIDASLNSLGDRAELIQVKNPLGISESPIIAPDLDVFGQFRGDDPTVSPPNGLGSNIFKDRGAIDRVDFFAPQAVLANPEDNGVLDLDPDANEVWINEPDLLRQFIVRLDDEGIGIDDRSAVTGAFMLYQDDVLLVDGVDYIFTYNSNTNEAIFTSVTTFEFERFYRIEVDNDNDVEDGVNGIRDLAGNFLAANQTDGTTQFVILVTDGENDPPENTVPDDQTLPEDAVFVFSSATGTSLSVSDPDVHLGNNELRVTLTATDGTLSLGSLAGLTFSNGDGVDDVTMTFTGDVDDINAALDGTSFTPTAEFAGNATVTIRTEDQGQFSGPPPSNEEDIDVITLEYISVNDAPTFDIPGSPPAAVNEDAGPQSITGFTANMDAGAPNEGGQTLTFIVTVTSTTGNLAFTSAPAIDATTGELTYETAPHTNGTATIRVELQDDGATGGLDNNTSAPQFFTLVVNAINDEPTFEFVGNTDPPAINEDAGPQTIPGYVTNIVPGPPEATDEVNQNVTLTFSVVGTTGNLEFTSISIDPDTGDLTYEAAPDTAGNGLIAVRVVDDGAAAPPPNDNEGETQLFTIVVNSVDDAPVAVTPDYVIDHGDTLLLDGTDSFDVDIPLGDSITYSWDLDNDGTFGDAIGATPAVPWTTLLGFGFTVPGEHTIQLRVTDAPNASGVSRDNIVQATVTVIAVDYGDAPASFGTTRAGDGAAHEILPGFSLGSSVDSDIDGVASNGANGDDNSGTDDEDGVTFHTTIEAAPGQALTSPFTVDVTADFAAKLDVWVDFNNDGVFDAATEHANSGIAYDVFNGTQFLPLTVPAGATLGTVAARFRLSTSGGLNPTGRADNGEVEDHQVTIIAVQAPVVPSFTAPGNRTIDQTPTFQWTDDQANSSYQFQLRDSDGNIVEDRQNLGVPEHTIATDLPFGVYTYRVRAFNRAGTASAFTAAQTLEVAPPATVINTPNGRVPDATPTFSWDAIPGVVDYQVQVDNVTTGQNNVIDVTVSETFYTASDDLPIGEYRVRVRGIAGGVNGDFTANHTFLITTAPNITSPDSLTFDDTPTIEWEEVLGAGSYQVRVRLDGSNQNILNETGITGTSFTVPESLPFGTYRVLVRANSADDPRFFGDNDTERFTVVVRPQLLTSGRITDPTPVIRWEGVEGGLSYEIRVHDRTRGINNLVRVDGIEGLSYTLPRLQIGRYAVSVRAVNPFGETSLWSRTRVVRIVTRPQLIGPSDSFFNQQPLFEWQEREGVQDYEIRVHKLLSGGDARVDNFIRLIVPGGALSYGSPYETVDGLRQTLPRNGYQWFVRGIASDGLETLWSDPLTFRTTGEPDLDEVGTTSDRTPRFQWTDVEDAVSYIFRIRRTDNNETVLQESGITTNRFTPTEPLEPDEYRAWVRAVSADGTLSPWSSVVFTITTSAKNIEFSPIIVEPVIDQTVADGGVDYLAQVDMPLIADPVINVTDPAIEIVSEQPVVPLLSLIHISEPTRPY